MIYGIGHSTHSEQEFIPLMRDIPTLIDIRSHPTSRWEQWRLENMKRWLPAAAIEVIWEPRLGGWTQRHYEEYAEEMLTHGVDLAAYSKGAFPKQRIGVGREAQPTDRPEWTNQGLYDYAWFTTLPEFHDGLRRLVEHYSGTNNAALICAEALWWKCHRSMVADALWYIYGIDLQHVKPTLPVRPTTARFSSHVAQLSDRIERYPDAVLQVWNKYKSD